MISKTRNHFHYCFTEILTIFLENVCVIIFRKANEKNIYDKYIYKLKLVIRNLILEAFLILFFKILIFNLYID